MSAHSLHVTRLALLAYAFSASTLAANTPAQSPQEESKQLLLKTTWEARVWGPRGKGYYPTVKCQDKGTDVMCAYSGGTYDQEIKYEVLANGELRTATTRGMPVILMRKGDGFESLSSQAGIQLLNVT